MDSTFIVLPILTLDHYNFEEQQTCPERAKRQGGHDVKKIEIQTKNGRSLSRATLKVRSMHMSVCHQILCYQTHNITNCTRLFRSTGFSGTSADADTWLAHFQRYAEYRQLSDEDIIAIFPLFLRDTATDWYETLSRDVKSNLETLLDNFTA